MDESQPATFARRCYEWARTMVAASSQLDRWLLDGERDDVPGPVRPAAEFVARPA